MYGWCFDSFGLQEVLLSLNFLRLHYFELLRFNHLLIYSRGSYQLNFQPVLTDFLRLCFLFRAFFVLLLFLFLLGTCAGRATRLYVHFLQLFIDFLSVFVFLFQLLQFLCHLIRDSFHFLLLFSFFPHLGRRSCVCGFRLRLSIGRHLFLFFPFPFGLFLCEPCFFSGSLLFFLPLSFSLSLKLLELITEQRISKHFDDPIDGFFIVFELWRQFL